MGRRERIASGQVEQALIGSGKDAVEKDLG